MTLVQMMISLAHSLRLKVIAEGVDAEEQAKMLHLLRCDEMQGYLISRPVPFEKMTEMLASAARASPRFPSPAAAPDPGGPAVRG
jgi:EAL domain-containing protein (putative c-di-GMP-specific phosphodiesterase class I)